MSLQSNMTQRSTADYLRCIAAENWLVNADRNLITCKALIGAAALFVQVPLLLEPPLIPQEGLDGRCPAQIRQLCLSITSRTEAFKQIAAVNMSGSIEHACVSTGSVLQEALLEILGKFSPKGPADESPRCSS